jgi:hypothetical protein
MVASQASVAVDQAAVSFIEALALRSKGTNDEDTWYCIAVSLSRNVLHDIID